MNVGEIRSRNIVRAPRSCALLQAAILMRQHHVGALLVTEDPPNDDRVVGIVTDRDLVLRAMALGLGPGDATLGDVMSSELTTIRADSLLHDAIEEMRRQGVRRLGVTAEDGALVGLISFDDVVDAIAARLAASAKDASDLAMAAEFEALSGILRTARNREENRNDAAPFVP
jgi:CBS domain-containing protein